MPPVIIADTAKVDLEWQWLNAGTVHNILHLELTSTLTQAYCDAVTALIESNYTNSGMDAVNSDGFTLSSVTMTDLRTSTGPQFTTASGIAGTSAVNALPAQVALVATEYTALRGRSYRGRVYLSGWTETENGYSAPTAAAILAAHDFIDGIRQDLASGGGALVVASPLLGTSEAVTSVVVNNRWDTQRRRTKAFGGS